MCSKVSLVWDGFLLKIWWHREICPDDSLFSSGNTLLLICLMEEGDSVKARVVEIDRRRRRITASLQSAAMIEKEMQSLKERSLRKQRKHEKGSKANAPADSEDYTKETSMGPDHAAKFPVKVKVSTEVDVVDESQLSKADLKRKRKLERRADRRTQKELTGISA